MTNSPIELTQEEVYILVGLTSIWNKFVSTLTGSSVDRANSSEFSLSIHRLQQIVMMRAAVRSMGGVLDPTDGQDNGQAPAPMEKTNDN